MRAMKHTERTKESSIRYVGAALFPRIHLYHRLQKVTDAEFGSTCAQVYFWIEIIAVGREEREREKKKSLVSSLAGLLRRATTPCSASHPSSPVTWYCHISITLYTNRDSVFLSIAFISGPLPSFPPARSFFSSFSALPSFYFIIITHTASFPPKRGIKFSCWNRAKCRPKYKKWNVL